MNKLYILIFFASMLLQARRNPFSFRQKFENKEAHEKPLCNKPLQPLQEDEKDKLDYPFESDWTIKSSTDNEVILQDAEGKVREVKKSFDK